MTEYIETLQQYGINGWPVAIIIAVKWFKIDRWFAQFYTDIVKPWLEKRVARQDERLRSQLAKFVSERVAADLIYAHYMSIARHIITAGWRIRMSYTEGEIHPEALAERLRTESRDTIGRSKEALSELTCYNTGKHLGLHLWALDGEGLTLFFAPILADISQGVENCAVNYESFRFRVLAQADSWVNDANDLIIFKKPKNDE